MHDAAYDTFFRRMFPRLTRYARARADDFDAEDLAAVALLTLWTKDLPDPTDETTERRLQSLAYRVLDGHISNARRSAASRARILEALMLGTPPERWDTDLADRTAAGETPTWVGALSAADSTVLTLVAEGYRVVEIAVMLDCRPATVSTQLHRARRRARDLLAERTEHGT